MIALRLIDSLVTACLISARAGSCIIDSSYLVLSCDRFGAITDHKLSPCSAKESIPFHYHALVGLLSFVLSVSSCRLYPLNAEDPIHSGSERKGRSVDRRSNHCQCSWPIPGPGSFRSYRCTSMRLRL